MADAKVSDLLEQLASITTQLAKEEIKLIVGADEEVQELKDKLGIIRAGLDDAEEGQVKQHVESLWLARLKDAYYEMDDVLDSWNTARIKSEIEKEEGKSADSNATPAVKKGKVCSLSSPSRCQAYNNLALHRDIGHKIKKLNETLDKIVKLFGFDLTRQLEVVAVDRPITTSFDEVPDIIKENMEMKAEEYFEVLAMKHSFFQDFEKNEYDGRIVSCKMHDIVHDFAQSMTKNECFIIDGDEESRIDLKSARHLHLKISKESKFPEYVYEAKNLRTLILTSGQSNHYFDMLLSNLFEHFRYLRTLYLDCRIKNIPDTVENLIHLRCLLMSERVQIKELPETVCNLCNLQSLRFDGGGLKKLPHGMGKLINLKYLNISAYDGSWEDVKFPSPFPKRGGDVILPKGIGKLTYLKTLRDFYICGKDEREECKLGELKNLDELRVLRINGLRNVVDVSEAENAQLKKKKYLRHLILHFGHIYDRRDERMKNDVLTLNALEPHPDLEILGILNYLGPTVYPNWLMSLTKLKILSLRHLTKLESLPPLGKLPSLERLEIRVTLSLKKVGVEFLGIESKNKKDDRIFPRLKSLEFEGLYKLEEWIGFEGMREEEDNGITIIMPRLQLLQIKYCPALKSLPDFLRTTPLKELNIILCPSLSKSCERGIGEEWPKISHIPNIEIDGEYVQRDGLTPSD